MTLIRKSTINTSGFTNIGTPKINKHFTDDPKPSSEPVGVSFEKPAPALTFDIPDAAPESNQEVSKPEEQPDRRTQLLKAAQVERRAQNELKLAREKLAQVKQFETLMEQAKNDPTAIAKALNMDPTEFLRKYQNQMFSIPNEPEKPKEETIEEKFAKYEQERKLEKEELLKMQANNIKNNYIQTKILPVIKQSPEQFEIINSNGAEQCAQFIYDMMDAHFRSTGEELNALDVAEEMEFQLQKEFESRIESTKKLKKFSKHFRTDTDAPGQELTIPEPLGTDLPEESNQLGASPALTDSSLNTKPFQSAPKRKSTMPSVSQMIQQSSSTYDKTFNSWNKKEEKLRRMEEMLKNK